MSPNCLKPENQQQTATAIRERLMKVVSVKPHCNSYAKKQLILFSEWWCFCFVFYINFLSIALKEQLLPQMSSIEAKISSDFYIF